MDHAEAMRLEATERYLLGELDEAQRDAFEAHFFECRECAESVRAGAAFVAASRSALHAPVALPPRTVAVTGWGSFAAFAGLAAALCLVAYQGLVVIPRLQSEVQALGSLRAVPSRFLTVSRGEAPTVTVSNADRQLVLVLSQSFETPFPSYRCELRDASDRVILTGTLTPRPGADELEVLLPLAGLPSGSYTLVVEGLGGSEAAGRPGEAAAARYAFKLEHR
jgi:Putative zinc-finger